MKKFKINHHYSADLAVIKIVGLGEKMAIIETEDGKVITSVIGATRTMEHVAIDEPHNIKIISSVDEIKIEKFALNRVYCSTAFRYFKVVAIGTNYISIIHMTDHEIDSMTTHKIKFNADTEYIELSGIELLNAVDYYTGTF